MEVVENYLQHTELYIFTLGLGTMTFARENCNGVQDSFNVLTELSGFIDIDLSFEQNGNCITEMQQISIGRPLTAIYA